MTSAEGKRTARFSEKSLNLENSLKSEVRLPKVPSSDTSVTKVTNKDLYSNKLGMLKQECKTQWSSTHNCGLPLMKAQENIQKFCVQETMTDVEVKNFKMGVDDWDINGQCTTSLMTVAAVVKQTEGDKYPTSSLVLPFMNSCMRSLSEDSLFKQT